MILQVAELAASRSQMPMYCCPQGTLCLQVDYTFPQEIDYVLKEVMRESRRAHAMQDSEAVVLAACPTDAAAPDADGSAPQSHRGRRGGLPLPAHGQQL